MWTIYDHPSDFPDKYVARLFEVDAGGPRPTDNFIAVSDVEELRQMFLEHFALTCISRSPEDDPKIVETWL
jgi:hypothetical protein